MKFRISKTVGSTLIVAGTTIGAGMLALPITTGVTGFWYSSFLLLACFAFMLFSVFLLLEVNLWSTNKTANLITLVKERLGIVGQIVAWLSFLLLLYSVAAAYLSGGGSLTGEVFGISSTLGIWIFMIIFGFVVIFETKFVDIINRFLMFGLIGAFIFLLFSTTPYVKVSHFTFGKPEYLFAAVPVVILSFTSHIIVPSLRTYLGGDVGKLKRALFIGSCIPLIFYLVWEFLIIGVLPLSGPYGLEMIGEGTHPVAGLTTALNAVLGFPWIAIIVGFFSFFALVTSFFGVALSLYHFLADGLSIRKNFTGKIILLIIMFAPPLLFALFYPAGFILAIGYAGVFVAILYGILPTIMAWKGRYIEKVKGEFRVPGGKFALFVIFIGSVAVIFFQIAATKGWLPSL